MFERILMILLIIASCKNDVLEEDNRDKKLVNQEDSAKQPLANTNNSPNEEDDGFYCTVDRISSLMIPGNEIAAEDEHEHESYICRRMITRTVMATDYILVGDIQSFFSETDPSNAVLFVPHEAVGTNDTISLNDGVEIENDKLAYVHNSKEVNRIGIAKVLIVRISGNTDKTRVKQSASKLSADYFGETTSLRRIIKDCSNDKLKVTPAVFISDKARSNAGVINIPAPANICEMNHIQVGNYAKLYMAPDGGADDANHYVFVMPNSDCVRMGAPAWASVGRGEIWVQSKYASFPTVQVHEFGHNLGFKHSSKGDDRYGDPTGYMGNKPNWDEDGNKMCFNAAKMYYSSWYKDKTDIYSITNGDTNKTYNISLVGLDDIRNNNSKENDKLVAGFRGANGHLYVMYNRQKGVNSEVKDYGDEIVIVQQDLWYTISRFKVSLKPGESWSFQINDNKTVTFKFNDNDSEEKPLDRAIVTVSILGDNPPEDPEDNDGTVYVDNKGNWQNAFDRDVGTYWTPGTKEVKVWYKFPSGIRKKVVAVEFTRPPTNAKGSNFVVGCNLKGYYNGDIEKNERTKYWKEFDLTQKPMYRIEIPTKKQGLYDKYKLWCKRSGQQTGKFKAAEIKFITDG